MKAIETRYKGYRFRSRLEARWAVFFDAIDVSWAYEVEGYEFENGVRYLPDFTIRTIWSGEPEFFEIKPEWPSKEELLKANMLASWSCTNVWIFAGQPFINSFNVFSLSCFIGSLDPAPKNLNLGWSERFAVVEYNLWDRFRQNISQKTITDAYYKARSARFEFGESG